MLQTQVDTKDDTQQNQLKLKRLNNSESKLSTMFALQQDLSPSMGWLFWRDTDGFKWTTMNNNWRLWAAFVTV